MDDEILLVLSVDVFFDQVDPNFKKIYSLENLKLLPEIANTIDHTLNSHDKPRISWLVSNNAKILKKFVEIKDEIIINKDEIGLHCLISKLFPISNLEKP